MKYIIAILTLAFGLILIIAVFDHYYKKPQSTTVPYTGKEYGNDTVMKVIGGTPATDSVHWVQTGKPYIIKNIKVGNYFCDTIDWKQKFDSLIKIK